MKQMAPGNDFQYSYRNNNMYKDYFWFWNSLLVIVITYIPNLLFPLLTLLLIPFEI